MGIHYLKPDPSTLHGAFSMNRPPVLHIHSGDTIEGATLDAGWGIEAPRLDGVSRQRHPLPQNQVERGHALIGPIWIKDAKPGMTLIVHIETLIPGPYGFTYAGGFSHRIHDALRLDEGGEELLVWRLDAQTMTGINQFGHQVRLEPFLGILGMPPPLEGFHPTAPPRIWGGNIDCKALVAGTRLYLPIPVAGALFSFGDGHAAQGHGEVSVQAIECPMEVVQLRLELDDQMKLKTPRAWTPAGWLTFGFDVDLERATLIALDAMIELMMAKYGLTSRKQALALATAVVDLHITQIANPVVGAHAFLPHDALLT